MNKLIKLGAVALFSFFVVACNKADPAADLKKLTDWQAAQNQSQMAFQQEFQQKMATQDPAQIDAAVKDFGAKVAEIQKGLDALDIKSEEVKGLKDKMKAALVLSNELVLDSVKVMQNPTEEAQKAILDKTQKVMQAQQDLVKLQSELQAKYPAK